MSIQDRCNKNQSLFLTDSPEVLQMTWRVLALTLQLSNTSGGGGYSSANSRLSSVLVRLHVVLLQLVRLTCNEGLCLSPHHPTIMFCSCPSFLIGILNHLSTFSCRNSKSHNVGHWNQECNVSRDLSHGTLISVTPDSPPWLIPRHNNAVSAILCLRPILVKPSKAKLCTLVSGPMSFDNLGLWLLSRPWQMICQYVIRNDVSIL